MPERDSTAQLFELVEASPGPRCELRLQADRKADGSLYCTVAGLGVQAGGYRSLDEAYAAWLDAREFLMQERS